MFPEKLIYAVDERQIGKKTEWVLRIWFDDRNHESWVVYAWDEKPSDTQIEDMISFLLRGIDIYRRSFTIPQQPCATKWE